MFALFFITKKTAAEQERVLQQQALTRNGTVEKGRFFTYPRLKFLYEDMEVTVYAQSGGKNSPPFTFIIANFNLSREYHINIYKESGFSKIGKSLGMQDILVNNPDFDDTFVIKGSDEAIVRTFLTTDVQDRLIRMKDFNPTVMIQKNKFNLFVPRLINDQQQYDVFIDTGLAMIKSVKQLG